MKFTVSNLVLAEPKGFKSARYLGLTLNWAKKTPLPESLILDVPLTRREFTILKEAGMKVRK